MWMEPGYSSANVYLLPFYSSYIKCRKCYQKHKFIYLRNKHIIEEKLEQIEKTNCSFEISDP